MNRTRIASFFLATLLLLLPLAACQPKGGSTPTLADLTPTDTLVLYISEAYESLMRPQIDRYTELYGVKVEVVRVGGGFEEYAERVAGDLASGGGPDVLFFDYLYMDIAKAALNNNFLDLTELLAEDEDFSEDDYVVGAFEAGRFGGRQYTVPTSYYSSLYLSTQVKLEELGFDWEGIGKTSDFLEEIARLTPYAEQDVDFAQMMPSKNYFEYLFMASGIRLLDYENNRVLPDEEALSDFLHACKSYFPYDYDESGMISTPYFNADLLIHGQFLFYFAGISIADSTWNIDALREKSFDYVFYALPGEKGEIIGIASGQMAISANAKNQLNAYNFIKMMLSEDIQCDRKILSGNAPIHKEAIKKTVYGTYESSGLNGTKYAGYQSTQLSDEELDALIETISGVDQLTQLVSTNLYKMMFDSMLPFFKDEKSYEDCLAELRNKLTFYLSE